MLLRASCCLNHAGAVLHWSHNFDDDDDANNIITIISSNNDDEHCHNDINDSTPG